MSTTSKSSAKPKAEQSKELSVKDLATRLKVDPKDLRKWLRSEGLGLGGRGKRYAFTPQQATQLTKKWKAAHKEEAADAS